MSARPTATPPEKRDGLVRLRGLPSRPAPRRTPRRAITTHRLGDLNGLFAGHEAATGGGKKIRICVVDTILQTGGAEWFATQLCLLAHPGIFDVVVAAYDSEDSPLAERLRANGITVMSGRSWNGSGLQFEEWKTGALFDMLDRLNPDLLFFSSQYLFEALPKDRLARYPSVVRISNFHAEALGSADFSSAAQVICTTQEQYDAVSRSYPGMTTLISTGVDTATFSPATKNRGAELKAAAGLDGKTVVLFVARLGDPLKRTPVFQEVVRRVKASRSDIAFVVVGYFESHNRDAEPGFRAFVEEEGVTWKERVDPWDMPDVYRMADVLISTSAPHEGLSNTVLQALSAGVVPVVTDAAGMEELVEPGETGFLVSDAGAESLAQAIMDAADLDEPARRRLTASGRERVESRYSLDRSAMQYQRAFLDVFRRRPATVSITDGYFGIGGAEWLAALLILNSDPEAIRFELVLHQARTDLVAWLEERGVVVHEADPGSSYTMWLEGGLEDMFRRLRPDVVMPCTITTWPPHAPFYRLLIISQNASDAAVLTRAQYDEADYILCVSEDVRNHLSADHQWKMSVLHNSIDVEMFKPDAAARGRVRDRLRIPADAKVVLWCGRMHEARKRLDVLQDVIAAMGDDESVHFLVVGYFRGDEGDKAGWLRTMEAHANVSWVSDVNPWEAPEHYAAADVYLSTSGFKQSDFEGLSVATVQALATALPVVTTMSGGQQEVVEDGRNGRLVDTGDVAGLARALSEIVGADHEAFESMRRHSREKALASFDIRRHARTYTRVARLLRDNVGTALAADPELAAPSVDFEDADRATPEQLRTAASFLHFTWALLREAAEPPEAGAGQVAVLSPAEHGEPGTFAAELERLASRLGSGSRLAVEGIDRRAGAVCTVLDHLRTSFPLWANVERDGRRLVLTRR